MKRLRVGIVGLGANTKLRHVPGLRACPDVAIMAVCNRTAASTRRAASEFDIPVCCDSWQELVGREDIDAVVIGTWPYLHCDITLAALEAGKHVLTEARMARNADEAQKMLDASLQHPELIAQIVPSPLGFRQGKTVRQMLDAGWLGELRECVVLGANASLADRHAPLHWRQSRALSGNNTLALGILHETLMRWVPDPVAVQAAGQVFVTQRESNGKTAEVDVPDVLHVMTELPGGARGLYHLSGVAPHGPGNAIHLYGEKGVLKYDFDADQLWAATVDEPTLQEVPTPADQVGSWRVERDFVEAIRGGPPIELTDFATGVRYMKFTDTVIRSAASGRRETLA